MCVGGGGGGSVDGDRRGMGTKAVGRWRQKIVEG